MGKIFYDEGRRWQKIKLVFLFLGLFSGAIIFFLAYSLFNSPYESPLSTEEQERLALQVEEVNTQTRVVKGQGAFLSINETNNVAYPYRYGDKPKRVILTFDDGPDPISTPKILKALSDQQVKGTFFVVGSHLYNYPEVARQIIKQGSDIGLHTYSHIENVTDTRLPERTFTKELDFTAKVFQHLFGYKNMVFRIPFVGIEDTLSYNALQFLRESSYRGLIVSAPTVDSRDWESTDPKVVADHAINNKTEGGETAIILLHDGGGNREGTLQALPEIIQYYRQRGYTFSTVSEYAAELGLAYKADLTPHERLVSAAAYSLYHTYRQAPKVLDKGFVFGFILVVIHSGIFVAAAILQVIYRKNRKPVLDFGDTTQFVSIIVPMYNEENSIHKTVVSILNSSYRYFELIVVDDGSTDESLNRLQQFRKNRRVKILKKSNGGKYSALNYGLKRARGSIVIFIDADTVLHTHALKEVVDQFHDRKIGAVAGHIIIGNKVNAMTILQALEYTVGQNIEKRVADLFHRVMIAPGAFSAWRTDAVRKAGGFSSETHVEDFDLTLSIMKQGYLTCYSDKAIAYTEAPQSLSQLIKQRLRWNFGNLQVYFKHRDMLFNKRHGIFGLLLFPREVFLQLPLTLLTPFVDLFIILNVLIGDRQLTLMFLGFYLLNQLAVSFIAYRIYGRSLRDIIFTPLMRFSYTQIMYSLTLITVLRALRGELVHWAKITHFGKLPLVEESYSVIDGAHNYHQYQDKPALEPIPSPKTDTSPLAYEDKP